MKVQILVLAVLAALGSRAALAASEGGDTWSVVQQVERSPYPVLQSALRAEPAVALSAAWAGSESGDTWSNLRALQEATVQRSGSQAHAARTDARVAAPSSEGGDTWSRFLPQPKGAPASTAGIAPDEIL